MPTNKIPTRQLIGFLIVARLSFSIANIIALHLPPYNQDQWIVVIVSGVYSTIASLPLLFLSTRIKNYTVKEFLNKLYGKNLNKIIAILYAIYFILQTVNILTLQTELVTSSILPEVPNFLITTLMLMTCMYMVSLGLSNMFKGIDLLFPLTYLMLFVLILLGLNNVDLSLLLPILKDSSFLDINKGALILSTIYNDAIIIAILVPKLENKNNTTMVFLSTLIINIILIIIVIIVTQGTLGIEYAKHSAFPFLLYVRIIKTGNIIERIAAIFVMMWLMSVTTRINIFLYLSTKALRDIFNKKEDDKIMLFIISIITLIIALSISERRPVVGVRNDINIFLAILFVIFIIVIPLITCIVYFLKRKSIDQVGNSEDS